MKSSEKLFHFLESVRHWEVGSTTSVSLKSDIPIFKRNIHLFISLTLVPSYYGLWWKKVLLEDRAGTGQCSERSYSLL